jgi:hypothetical protein
MAEAPQSLAKVAPERGKEDPPEASPKVRDDGRLAGPAAPRTRVILHEEVPEALGVLAHETLERCRAVLRIAEPEEVYLGKWDSMPSHFLLGEGPSTCVGVNLPELVSTAPLLSAGFRPVEVEIAFAFTTAVRYAVHGPVRDRLERVFVAGLGMCLSDHLWPRGFPWQHAGMPELDWLWCQEHGAHLWEEVRRFLEHPFPKLACFRWLLPDQEAGAASPIPAKATLFLGKRLLGDACQETNFNQCWSTLLKAGHPEIVRTFRRRVGLEGKPSSPQRIFS